MRLGKILSTLDLVLNENSEVFIKNEAIFGGQAYIVDDFDELSDALKLLSQQPWNTADFSQIKNILDNNANEEVVQLNTDEFVKLEAYVLSINKQVAYFHSILKTMVEHQDDKVINVKLPQKITTISELTKLNKRLDTLFKEFQVDTEFTFQRFDSGSDWYVMGVAGFLTYNFFISCLKIAQEYLKTKKEYYGSEIARLDYEAALGESEILDKTKLEKYTERRLDLNVQKQIKETVEEIGSINGTTSEELTTKLILATKSLVKELGNGVEFHLSLNPPSYAEEKSGKLEINYKSMREQREKDELATQESMVIAAPVATESQASTEESA